MNMLQLQSLKLYWSYNVCVKKPPENLVIEQVLKYGDTEAVVALFKIIDIHKIEKIWHATMQNDARFKRQNYFLKTFFLTQNSTQLASPTRFDKLKKLAAKY